MPVLFVNGDPLLTRAQTVAFGSNARGRTEVTAFHTALADRFPAAFASYGRQCRSGRLQPGDLWQWTESQPRLLFMVVHAAPASIVRLRHVEAGLLLLARDFHLYGVQSAALLLPGSPVEQAQIKPLVQQWLASSSLPVVVYEQYRAGSAADETPLLGDLH